MTREANDAPGIMGVYGSKISYYTGKFETYLRYRGIPYESFPTVPHNQKLLDAVGIVQMPVVQLANGRWMTDTTPMIAWLEGQQADASIYPSDPVLNFIALLIEDYADEWLWRSAMHYRWTYRISRQYAAEFLYNELIKGVPLIRGKFSLPRFAGINLLKRRQYFGFVRGDGVAASTRDHVDGTYLAALDRMQAILARRPFLLGDTPTIADFGMMAPMFRHFSQDPTPAEIMRERAPNVYEWVARMWTIKPNESAANLITGVDQSLGAFLDEICETHFEQQRQNADAYSRGQKRFDMTIQGTVYKSVPSSRYRVWCLEQMRAAWMQLEPEDASRLKNVLSSKFAQIIWDETDFKASGYDAQDAAPFNRAINVFEQGVP